MIWDMLVIDVIAVVAVADHAVLDHDDLGAEDLDAPELRDHGEAEQDDQERADPLAEDCSHCHLTSKMWDVGLVYVLPQVASVC